MEKFSAVVVVMVRLWAPPRHWQPNQVRGGQRSLPFTCPLRRINRSMSMCSHVREEYEHWWLTLASLDSVERTSFDQFAQRTVPAGIYQTLVAAVGDTAGATRQLASIVEQKAAEIIPYLVGGSADLNSSIMTKVTSSSDVGLDGLVIGIDRFGESAPWKRLQTEFEFSADQVVHTIRERFWAMH